MRWLRSVLIGGAVLGLLGMGFMELVRSSEIQELKNHVASTEHRQQQLAVIAHEIARYRRSTVRLDERLQTAKQLETEQWSIVGGVPARDEARPPPDGGAAEPSAAMPSRPSAVGWRELTGALLAESGLRRLEVEGGTLVATYTGTEERLGRLGHALLEDGRIRSFVTAQGGEAASLHAVLEPGPFREGEP